MEMSLRAELFSSHLRTEPNSVCQFSLFVLLIRKGLLYVVTPAVSSLLCHFQPSHLPLLAAPVHRGLTSALSSLCPKGQPARIVEKRRSRYPWAQGKNGNVLRCCVQERQTWAQLPTQHVCLLVHFEPQFPHSKIPNEQVKRSRQSSRWVGNTQQMVTTIKYFKSHQVNKTKT